MNLLGFQIMLFSLKGKDSALWLGNERETQRERAKYGPRHYCRGREGAVEDLLELGESQLPLKADSEINNWRFLVMLRMVSFMSLALLSSSSNFSSFSLISESPRQGWRRRTAWSFCIAVSSFCRSRIWFSSSLLIFPHVWLF